MKTLCALHKSMVHCAYQVKGLFCSIEDTRSFNVRVNDFCFDSEVRKKEDAK